MAIKKYKGPLKLIIKILVSALAFFYITSEINFSLVWEELKAINPIFLILAVGFYCVSQLVSSCRLNTLFGTLPLNFPALANAKLYWVGMFYNFFLPGGVGGDGYKIIFLKRYFANPVKDILGAILSDRLSGLTIISCIILALSFFIPQHLPYQKWYFLLIPVAVGSFFLFLVIMNKKLSKAFWSVSAFSVLIQGIQIVAVIFLLLAIDVDVSKHGMEYLFLFFVSTVASAIPISLGGIGTREVVFYSGSLYMEVNPEQALALSLLFYFTTLISSLPGIYFILTPAAIQSEGKELQTKKVSTELNRA